MKKNISSSLGILVIISVWMSACSPKKQIVKAPEATKDTSSTVKNSKLEQLQQLKQKDLPFNTLSLKGKANLNIDGNENNVTLNIRIKNGEKIWFSVSALGGAIEAARGFITPDSIQIMNKLQRTILKKPISYIYDFTNSQVNYTWLQSILSGNTIQDLIKEKSDLTQENGVWTVKGQDNGLVYQVLFNTLLKSEVLNLNDAAAGQALKVNYADYTPLNNALFPSKFKINSLAGPKKINVSIDFVKIEANVPVEFPFTVPRNYELIH